MEPLYKMCGGGLWNNRAPAMDVELTPPQGIEISPGKMKGPDVKEDADADPREFLA